MAHPWSHQDDNLAIAWRFQIAMEAPNRRHGDSMLLDNNRGGHTALRLCFESVMEARWGYDRAPASCVILVAVSSLYTIERSMAYTAIQLPCTLLLQLIGRVDASTAVVSPPPRHHGPTMAAPFRHRIGTKAARPHRGLSSTMTASRQPRDCSLLYCSTCILL